VRETAAVGPEYAVQVDGEWQLVGSRCTQCGTAFVPIAATCASCGSRSLETAHLGGPGTVYTRTTVGFGPPGFDAPYGLAWVDLPSGARAFGQLANPEEVAIGDTVEIEVGVIRHDADGTAVLGHVFRKRG
jgi:uncharacterized OB-fold protein